MKTIVVALLFLGLVAATLATVVVPTYSAYYHAAPVATYAHAPVVSSYAAYSYPYAYSAYYPYSYGGYYLKK